MRTSLRAYIIAALGIINAANAAQAETWYCALQNDPTIATYGQQITPYRVEGNKVIDSTAQKFPKELNLSKSDPLRFKLENVAMLDVLRNDGKYLIASGMYDWNGGLNIRIIIIKKENGAFLSTSIYTWDNKSDTYNGSCTSDAASH